MRRELVPWLTGRTIVQAELVEAVPGPKYAGLERAAGQRISGVTRRGKFLLLPLERDGKSGATVDPVPPAREDGRVVSSEENRPDKSAAKFADEQVDPRDELIVHLGMTGVLSHCPPPGHLRVRLRLDDGPRSHLYFRDIRRFGRFTVVAAGDYRSLPTLAAIGPEPLSEEFSVAAFRRALARSEMAVKSYLLSQRPVAGVGNIYADEALWHARIHPETAADNVPAARVAPLRDAIRSVLEASIAAQGTTLNDYRTVNGEVGGYLEQLAVYGRTGRPCLRCGAEIARRVIGGRSSHFCPRCQRRRF